MFRDIARVLALVLLIFGVGFDAQAESTRLPENPWIIKCSDGRLIRELWTNYDNGKQIQTDAQLCGEAEPDEPVGPEVPAEYILIFGERPTGSTLEQRGAKQIWDTRLSEFLGVVPPPSEAEFAGRVAERFCYGEPLYYLSTKGEFEIDENGKFQSKPGVMVSFPSNALGATAKELGIFRLKVFLNGHPVIAASQRRYSSDGALIPESCRHPFARFRSQ